MLSMKMMVGGLVLALAFSVSAQPSFEEREISSVEWSVKFISRVYDPFSDTTTFTYELTVLSGRDYKDLSHWVLAIDSDCDQIPVGSGNVTSFGLDPTTGLYGFKWDDGQPKGTTQTYTVTFTGEVGSTEVKYSVKGGTYFAVGTTTGPGCQIVDPSYYFISGTLYLDANGNGARDEGEPLLPNVTVDLMDEAGSSIITTMLTDANGFYSFSGLVDGHYMVNVPPNTSTIENDFNELLSTYFTTPANSLIVLLAGDDSTGNDIGYTVQTDKLITAIQTGGDGGLVGTGKTIGFWKHQITVAMNGKGRAQIDASTMRAYLGMVQNLYLADPFKFPQGFTSAMAVLSSTSSDARNLLLKQLLGTEFNHVGGLGLTGNLVPLQGVLIAWGEYLAFQSSSFTRDQLLKAKDLFDTINNSGE